jgi:hypothetical protein
MRSGIKKYLTKKEVIAYTLLYAFGAVIFCLPWLVIMLAVTIVLSPMFLILGEAPDWYIGLRDCTKGRYFHWLEERYNEKGRNRIRKGKQDTA